VRDLGVPVITSAEVVAASGGGWIDSIEIRGKRTKESIRLRTQAVVAALGFGSRVSRHGGWLSTRVPGREPWC
jgi:hypothetical protein